MLKIGISADEQQCREKIKNGLERYFSMKSLSYRIDLYEKGSNLYYEHVSEYGEFALVFMDVSAEGMEYVRKIRNEDEGVRIILVADSAEYAMDGYELFAFHYLLKPVSYERLKTVMDRFMRETFERQQKSLLVKHRSSQRRIPYADIVYVECNNKALRIHTAKEGDYQVYASISGVEKELKSSNFIRCHQSYIINLDMAKAVQENEFITLDGHLVPIRKKEVKKIRELYLDYVTKRQ